MDHQFVYFSKMFQAVPQLMEVQKHTGGTFVSNRRSTLNVVRRLYPDVKRARYSSWFSRYSAGYKAMQAADAIVTGAPTPLLLSYFSGIKCMVFHGTYWNLSADMLRLYTHFDLMAVIGPRMRETIARCRPELELPTVEVGYLPFGGYPEKTEASRVEALKGFKLDPFRKTVIYMPKGRPMGSWDCMAERVVREVPPEFNLIIRPHPSQAITARLYDRKSFWQIGKLAKERPNTLLDLGRAALPTLFSVADLIMSEGNSPAEESLFYDVPQLFITTPSWSLDGIQGYARKGGMHEADIERFMTLFDAGVIFDSASGKALGTAVSEALDIAPAYAEKRADYFRWVFGAGDRHAGKRLSQALENLLR